MGAESKKRPRKRRHWLWRWCRRFLLLGLAGVFLVLGVHQYVVMSVSDAVFEIAEVPRKQAILVLGASVLPSGRPSNILEERLRAAAELYHAGKAGKIIVSGDHGQRYYNEVGVMAKYLAERRVPAEDVFLDHAGFRTFDSVVRARKVFGAESVIIVSNPFHVPRALFLAHACGLEAVGVGADYGIRYSRRTLWRNRAREFAARLLAFGDVHLFDTKPKFLGPRIDLKGDGRVTRDRSERLRNR